MQKSPKNDNFTDVKENEKTMKMRDLESIKKALENEVRDYLERRACETEKYSEEIDLEVCVDGVEYCAIVSVTCHYSHEPHYETDKFGISYYMGDWSNLDDFDLEIRDLWDSEAEEYIVEDFKTIEK